MSKHKCYREDDRCECRKEHKKHHKHHECEEEPKKGCFNDLCKCFGNESFIIFLVLILLVATCGNII